MSDLRPHYLYRCYDADGLLLYIGCTSNVRRRMGAHRRGDGKSKASAWLSACMVRHEVSGPLAGLELARAAETAAIRAESPLFNAHGYGGGTWLLDRPIAHYLMEQGHLELAEATLCHCRIRTDAWCYVHDRPNAAWVDLDRELANTS